MYRVRIKCEFGHGKYVCAWSVDHADGSSCGSKHLTGCTVPPTGPGHFYPYWTEVTSKAGCTIEFGNVPARKGHRQTFGEDLQYGKNQFKKLSYPEFEGSLHNNTCPPSGGQEGLKFVQPS